MTAATIVLVMTSPLSRRPFTFREQEIKPALIYSLGRPVRRDLKLQSQSKRGRYTPPTKVRRWKHREAYLPGSTPTTLLQSARRMTPAYRLSPLSHASQLNLNIPARVCGKAAP